jgi:hypothetical protein
MKDRKLTALTDHFDAALNTANIYMWFAVPGGLIVGMPIRVEEYYNILSRGTVPKIENVGPDEPDRFLHLKSVTLHFGPTKQRSKTALLDALQVSAWGFIEVKPNTVEV